MRSNALLRVERVLGATILTALGAATAVACGSSGPVACGGCGCGDSSPPPPTDVNIPFAQCTDAGATDAAAGDADVDASVDASADASGGDAGVCFATCAEACQASHPGSTCLGTSTEGGEIVATCEIPSGACLGRKLDGLETPQGTLRLHGAMVARMAWLEAASVRAFERLARELRHHGAPRSLVTRALACARDEARHARMMARIARKHGARVPRVVATEMPLRDLESIARENAIEGCVGETFGAAQAAWRASHTTDDDMARAMGRIAPDELRHAALGWAVAAWVDAKLDEPARARVRAARNRAARELLQNATMSAEERAIAASLTERLWAA